MDGAYPVTVQNCGREVVLDEPPQRIVGLDQGTTEILLSLDVQDRMGRRRWLGRKR